MSAEFKYSPIAYKTIPVPYCSLISAGDYVIGVADYIITGGNFIISDADYRIIAGRAIKIWHIKIYFGAAIRIFLSIQNIFFRFVSYYSRNYQDDKLPKWKY